MPSNRVFKRAIRSTTESFSSAYQVKCIKLLQRDYSREFVRVDANWMRPYVYQPSLDLHPVRKGMQTENTRTGTQKVACIVVCMESHKITR